MRRIVGAMMCFTCLCLLTEASVPIICQRAICQSEMSFFLGGQWFEPNQNSCFLEATIQFTPIIWANIILLNTNYWCVCYSIFCCCCCFCWSLLPPCWSLLPPDEIIRNRSIKIIQFSFVVVIFVVVCYPPTRSLGIAVSRPTNRQTQITLSWRIMSPSWQMTGSWKLDTSSIFWMNMQVSCIAMTSLMKEQLSRKWWAQMWITFTLSLEKDTQPY